MTVDVCVMHPTQCPSQMQVKANDRQHDSHVPLKSACQGVLTVLGIVLVICVVS